MSETQSDAHLGGEQSGADEQRGRHRGPAAVAEEGERQAAGRHRRPPQQQADQTAATGTSV